MQVAYAAGVQVTLDCGGVEGPVTPELLQNVSIISPNETELARLTGGAPCLPHEWCAAPACVAAGSMPAIDGFSHVDGQASTYARLLLCGHGHVASPCCSQRSPGRRI